MAHVAAVIFMDKSPPELAGSVEDAGSPWGYRVWAARWIAPARGDHDALSAPVQAYGCDTASAGASRVRLHVTADERFALYLDGRLLARGPERGDLEHWMVETLEVDLPPGDHRWVAVVWSPGVAGHRSPTAQLSTGPGFLLSADGPWASALSTGVGPWQVKAVAGHTFLPPHKPSEGFLAGGGERVDGRAYPWGLTDGAGDGWRPAIADEPGRPAGVRVWGDRGQRPMLRPAMLPRMMLAPLAPGRVRFAAEEDHPPGDTVGTARDAAGRVVHAAEHDAALAERWGAMLRGHAAVSIPPHRVCRLVVDLEDHACFYPRIEVSGGRGGCILAASAEALFEPPAERRIKHHRDAVDGLVFAGRADHFIPDGGDRRVFTPLWWRCGRYIQLVIATAEQPLTVHRYEAAETRYPLEAETAFDCNEARWGPAARIMWRTLQNCAHETYMDCPFYEQLQYVGDTRLQALVTYVTTGDDRLPRKAIEIFEWSRSYHGLCHARYPSRGATLIPSFALHWVSMVHEFACWRGDRAFVAARLSAVRGTLEAFRAATGPDGVIGPLPGWQFIDGIGAWDTGVPPGAALAPNAILNWQAVTTLRQAAELEAWCGDPLLAQRNHRDAEALARATHRVFWNEQRQLYADDPRQQHFSEHAQVMAMLSLAASPDAGDASPFPRPAALMRRLTEAADLARTSLFFSHFLFEACRLTGRMDLLARRLDGWYALPGRGFRTVPENEAQTRSDCHAWSSHPLFHSRATWLGIRPAGPGFRRVVIHPQLGPLEHAHGTVPHRLGLIEVEAERCPASSSETDAIRGVIRLPDGLTGRLLVHGRSHDLRPGTHRFHASLAGIEVSRDSRASSS